MNSTRPYHHRGTHNWVFRADKCPENWEAKPGCKSRVLPPFRSCSTKHCSSLSGWSPSHLLLTWMLNFKVHMHVGLCASNFIELPQGNVVTVTLIVVISVLVWLESSQHFLSCNTGSCFSPQSHWDTILSHNHDTVMFKTSGSANVLYLWEWGCIIFGRLC